MDVDGKTCEAEGCNQWFEPQRSTARFCSETCGARERKRRQRKKTGEAHESEVRVCEECDTHYNTVRDDQRFCSDVCRNRQDERRMFEGRTRHMAERAGLAAEDRGPQVAYGQQVKAAEKAGIDWNLSFEDWWVMWAPHWHVRDLYRLYRLDMQRGYIANNVCVMTMECAAVYYEEPFRYEEIV